MKKHLLATLVGASLFSSNAVANPMENVGVALNYGVLSGPTFEVTYPIANNLQVRGALSAGMSYSDSSSESGIDTNLDAEGGIHRLALDYHPFQNNFFVSAGYAINNFKINIDGAGSGDVEFGNVAFSAVDIQVEGDVTWKNSPSLSLGWGHSQSKGFGYLFEVGVYFTGSANVDLQDSQCTVTLTGSDCGSEFDDAVAQEEQDQEDDIPKVLPVLQVGVTYKF